MVETKRIITETKTIKGKAVTLEREVIDYAVVVEKIGHRDGFYED